jgi:hypothetical protein
MMLFDYFFCTFWVKCDITEKKNLISSFAVVTGHNRAEKEQDQLNWSALAGRGVYTGDGKGKTTAVLGLAMRAAG